MSGGCCAIAGVTVMPSILHASQHVGYLKVEVNRKCGGSHQLGHQVRLPVWDVLVHVWTDNKHTQCNQIGASFCWEKKKNPIRNGQDLVLIPGEEHCVDGADEGS